MPSCLQRYFTDPSHGAPPIVQPDRRAAPAALTVRPYSKPCGCCFPGCFPCPFLTLCDAPAFTGIPVRPSQAILNGPPCTSASQIGHGPGSLGPSVTRVRVDVNDIAGRSVRTFEEGMQKPGTYVLTWDKHETSGAVVARGVYIVRLRAGAATVARKLVVVHR